MKTFTLLLEKWAADDLRSINAQIEFLLKEALNKAGRQRENPTLPPTPTPNE